MMIPKNIAVVWHPKIPAAHVEAERIENWLTPRLSGVCDCVPLSDSGFREALFAGAYDMVITLGGDGTMIRTGKLCAERGIPVMGINMGSFGFLIETQPDQWENRLTRLLRGEWAAEKRMMLRTEHFREGNLLDSWEVLNDAVVGRGEDFRPVHLEVRVDGALLDEYVVDGLIISTATGSTAYTMAAGGPILAPEMRNMLMTPIAPHLCLDKTLVLQEDDEIDIRMVGEVQPRFCPDGMTPFPLEENDIIRVRSSEHSARFVRFLDKGAFYRDFTRKMKRRPIAGRKSQGR